MYKPIFSILLFASFFACRSSKKTVDNAPIASETGVKTPVSGGNILNQIEEYYILPEWLNAKGNIDAAMGDASISLDAIIQIRKDSAILLIAKKFGFEGGRALITPDSVFIINRLEQTYDKAALATIAAKFNLPPQFDVIQKVLLGYPAKIDNATPFQLQQQDSVFVLVTEKATLAATHHLSKKDLTLLQTFVEEEQNNAKLTIQFDKYLPTNLQKPFAFHRSLLFMSPTSGQGEINIDLTDAEFNVPKQIRFQIPSHYKRKQIINN
jgi:hypothetical protein